MMYWDCDKGELVEEEGEGVSILVWDGEAWAQVPTSLLSLVVRL